MKISARNMFKGRVLSVKNGVITSQVTIDIGNGNVITSIISRESARDLKLKKGDAAYAVIKSTEVMIAK
jgi:molybdopterin-binding protein